MRLQVRQGAVPRVRLGILHHLTPMPVPALHKLGVVEERLHVGEFLRVKLLPEPSRVAKGGNATLGTDAGPGEHRHVLGPGEAIDERVAELGHVRVFGRK